MKINIHETLMNLNRGRITVDQAHDEIESAMCEANACPQLCEGWRDAKKELPESNTYCLTYTESQCYINQVYKGYWETEYPVYENKVIAWQKLGPPAFV